MLAATSIKHGIILEKLGAEVVYRSRMAIRLATRLETAKELDIIELSEQINISKMQVPEQLVGKSVACANLRGSSVEYYCHRECRTGNR